MEHSNVLRIKYACYTVNISMAVVANMSPILFLTFRSLYGISYSLLGTLVLVNFVTQLSIDLIFSFFSHKINLPLAVKLTPVLTLTGLVVYAVWPFLFPQHVYAGLMVGTLIFSASGGFSEVLMSPLFAALPSDNPDRAMSKLHSVYAWALVGVIVVMTFCLQIFGKSCWQWLALGFAIIPLVSVLLFTGSKIPELRTGDGSSSATLGQLKNKTMIMCFFAIFIGGAAEQGMAQWGSSYLEMVLGIPKAWGDILGVAMFSFMLGLGHSLYAKIGCHIGRVLFFGAVGASLCYLVAGVSGWAPLGLVSCAMTGFFVSMMWPGMLIVASDRIPDGGLVMYALMAAGGDMGASVAPQLLGVVTDAAMAFPLTAGWAQSLGLAPEQLGMKLGMLVGMLFPLIGVILYYRLWKGKKQ